MSVATVLIARVVDVQPHPNADKLDLLTVLGWQTCVQKGQYKPGYTVLYFPPDQLIPQEKAIEWGVDTYLSKGRVRKIALRGEPSFGFVLPFEVVAKGLSQEQTISLLQAGVGDNVADLLGVTKWEPPTRSQQGQNSLWARTGDALESNELFPVYTDIGNLRHYPAALFSPSELVVATEKIHGMNSRVGMVERQRFAGSRKVNRAYSEGSPFWHPWTLEPVRALLYNLGIVYRSVVLYGELYGPGIQSLTYGLEAGQIGYRAFDLQIDGRYVDFWTFMYYCGFYSVPTVPLVAVDNYGSFDTWMARAGGTTLLMTGGHIREGIVIRPLVERRHPKIGRAVLKLVSDAYLLGKVSDFQEV